MAKENVNGKYREKLDKWFQIMRLMGRKKKLYFGGLIITSLSYTIVQSLSSMAYRDIINVLIEENHLDVRIVRVLISVFFAIIITFILHPLFTYYTNMCVNRAIADIKCQCCEKILSSDFREMRKNQILSDVNISVEMLEKLYRNCMDNLCIAIIWGCGSIINIAILSGVICTYLVCLGILLVIINKKIAECIEDNVKENYSILKGFNETIEEIIDKIRTIKSFVAEKWMIDRSEKILENYRTKNIIIGKKKSVLTALGFLINIASILGIVVLGVFLIKREKCDYGTIVAIINLQSGLTYMFVNIGSYMVDFSKTLVLCEKILELFSKKEREEYVAATETMTEYRGIYFDHIYYSYKDHKIFNNFSLKINEKKMVAIYGNSGIGKSTIMKLLMRYYDLEKGNIYFGGKSIYSYTIDVLRANISYVPQDMFLFEDTIYQNIKYGNMQASYEEILEVSKIAGVEKFIFQTEKGYQTQVGGIRTNLSGGECQRIALARGLLKPSLLLILDEALSKLDMENELEILNNIKNWKKERTVIVITHRKEVEAVFDEVYYIDK